MRTMLALALVLPGAAAAQTAPTTSIWYTGNNGAQPGQLFRNQHQATVGGPLSLESTWANVTADLATTRTLYLGAPTTEFSAEMLEDLTDFVENQSGILVYAGDSNQNGIGVITVANQILTHLDAGMSLVDVSHSFTNPMDGTAVCTSAQSNQVVNPYIASGNPPAALNTGDIVVGMGAQNLATIDLVGGGTTRIAARRNRILLVSDYDLFTDNTCGLPEKQLMWDNIFDFYCDRDEDGDVAQACGQFDCNDLDAAEGNTLSWLDEDMDGYGDSDKHTCDAGLGVPNQGDCNDDNPNINPDAVEVCNELDDNCDNDIDDEDEDLVVETAFYPDADQDGFGRDATPTNTCIAPEGFVADNTDCDDSDDAINPEAEEICNNTVDEDCDGEANTCDPVTFVPPVTATPDPSCGCSATPSSMAWAWMGLGALLLRRRQDVR